MKNKIDWTTIRRIVYMNLGQPCGCDSWWAIICIKYVSYITGWKEYNRTLGTLTRCPHTNCDPSQLRSLKLVQYNRVKNPGIHESSYEWPAIQIEFTVPKPSFANNYGMFEEPYSSLRPSPHDFLVCLSTRTTLFLNSFLFL